MRFKASGPYMHVRWFNGNMWLFWWQFAHLVTMRWESEDSVSSQASLVLQLHVPSSAIQHILQSHTHNHLYLLLQLHKYLQCAISMDKCNIDIVSLHNTNSHHGASVVQNDMRPGWLNYLQFPTISSSPLLSSGDTSSSCHRNKVILAMQPPSFPFQSAAPRVRPRSRLLRRGEV